MVTKILLIDGMSCQHCVMEMKKQLSKLDVKIINVQIGSAEIDYDENKISNAQLEDAAKEAGFAIKN